ncbi:hypothetical protein KBD34_05390 [Patescibacteria group bacterium]|nr:hypothetical protein [Patescibacteria group bacterium]
MPLPVLSVASSFLQEELVSLFSYPIWWYSTGFQRLLHWAHEGLRYRWRKYALGLWLTHLTTPMYGEYSIWGRAVSLFMRVFVVLGRGIAWIAEALVYLLLIVVWFIWPLAAIFGLIYAALSQGAFQLI